jgi:hypothetical protein
MCTLSWQAHPDRLEILFSRDELHARTPARPPEVETLNGVRVLAPLDVQGGGTWLASNEAGLTVCLLNHYPDRWGPGSWKSRGLLVRALSPLGNSHQVRDHLEGISLLEYPRFSLLAFSTKGATARWLWNGEELREFGPPESPLSSSSLYPRLVPMLRRRLFRQATRGGSRPLTPERQVALHRGRRPWPPAFAVAMSRRDRGTVSLTRIRSTRTEVTMDYWEGDPAENPRRAPTHTLPVRTTPTPSVPGARGPAPVPPGRPRGRG